MKMESYLSRILNCFKSMDIGRLRQDLNENYNYQDTTQEIFLNEVEKIFEALNYSDDTELIIYPGKCDGKMCVNCGKKGYRFVGNQSKNYFDLLFETDGDDIKDIYHCEQFKIFDHIEGLGTRAEIEINLDDQTTFNKTQEYWSKVYAANKAWSEIITEPPRQLDFSELCYWVDKNTLTDLMIGSFSLFQSTDLTNMKWTPFSMLYADLTEITSYISNHIKDFKLANYQAMQIQTEQDLINWIVKYEDIHEKAPYDLKYCIEKENENFRLFPKNPILLFDPIFDATFSFFKFFQDHFDDIFLKYSTYIDDDNSIIFNTGGKRSYGVANFSLKFHLAHRKAMEDLGTEVPFFLNQKDKDNDVF